MRKKIFHLFLLTIISVGLLSACGSQLPETVSINLTEFGIVSSTTSFKAGETYRFVITNAGALNHEFTIMPKGAQGMSMEGHEMGEMDHDMSAAILHVSQDQLAPGSTVTVDFMFTAETVQDGIEFACHLPGHYEAGMFVPIAVQS